MYAKLGLMTRAQDIFDSLSNQDLVFWDTLLLEYAKFGPNNKVLHFFTHIQLDGLFLLRIKLKCGLVCELTLRVNRHSNGQESPLSHHYVF